MSGWKVTRRFPFLRRRNVLDEQLDWMVGCLALIAERDPVAAERLRRNIDDRLRQRDRDVQPVDVVIDVTRIVQLALIAVDAKSPVPWADR